MPDVEPLTAEEILALRRFLERRALFFKGVIYTLGTGIGAALTGWLLDWF